MGFENIQTLGMTFGYIFVIVIAGLALFVGAVKKKNRDKARLEESKKEQVKSETESNQTDKPETETVKEVPEKTEETSEKESDKNE